MSTLNSLTLHRLKHLPQSNARSGKAIGVPWQSPMNAWKALIWCNLNAKLMNESQAEYILWVDGSSGMVRAMDIIDASVGKEAMVRALLQAIERPQSPAKPGLPQKILGLRS
jgi:hypothetical protein